LQHMSALPARSSTQEISRRNPSSGRHKPASPSCACHSFFRLHLTTMRYAVLLLLCAFDVSALAQTSMRPGFVGKNCALTEPPPDSGEIFNQIGEVTIAGLVYPRLSQIPMNYTGCQVLWSSINGGPRHRFVTYIQAGRVTSIEPSPEFPLCKVGENWRETGCTPRRETVRVSFPPGCAARTVETNALPKVCMESFEAEFRLNAL